MPINLRTMSAALALAGVISFPALAAAPDKSSELLLRGAQNWVDRDRADLAKGLLNKLLLIHPTSPEGLAMLGKIELKNGKHAEAQQYLRTLQKTAPDNPLTADLNKAYLLATGTSAVDTPPPLSKPSSVTHPEAGLNIVAPQKTVQTKAFVTEKVVAVKPGKKSGKKTAKVAHPKKIAVASTAPATPVVTPEAESSPEIDADIMARTDALDALQDGNLDVAETALMDIYTRRPQDPEVLGGLGLIKQRQGKFADAQNWFQLAVDASKGDNPKWVSLVSLAEFWKNLRIASNLLEEKNLVDAEITIQKALSLKPEEPNALTLLAEIKSANNDLSGAESIYRDVLSRQGYNVSAIRGLSALLSRTQRSPEALALIEQALHNYQSELDQDPAGKAALLREASNLYIAEHRTSHAMQALETSVQLDPKNAWSRFSLAKLYISLNLAPLGRQVVQEGADISPKDPEMHYVRALVLLSMDDYVGALDSLAHIPDADLSNSMLETRNRALMQYYFQLAEGKLAKGDRKEAIRIMSVAETAARGNYSATEQVAEGWFKLGLQKQGLDAMRKLPQPVPLGTQIYWASLLNRAKMDQELTEYLPSLHIPEGADETNTKYRARIQEIEFAMAGRQYDKLMKTGKTEQAQQFADAILDAAKLNTADYFRIHRSYFSRAQLPDNAIELLNQNKEQFPNDLSLRYDLAYAYYQDKQNSNAQREIQELLAITPPDDIDMRLRIASLQQSTGDNSGARQTVDDLTTRYPNNTEALFQAGNFARSNGNYDQAMRYYQKTKEQLVQPAAADLPAAVAGQPADITLKLLPEKHADTSAKTHLALVSNNESDSIYRSALASDKGKEKPAASGMTASVDQAMESISSQRSAKIEAGIDIQSKTSSSGTSTYNAIEIPVLARFPIGYEAHGTLQIDKVNVDAGALPATFNEAALFGKVQAFQAPPALPVAQSASGTSVALGYEQDAVKADIGVVGQGFPVSNVVGGIRTGGDFGKLSYSLTLSRRPYTGSVLSYAGAKDTVTGEIWGGVTNTGMSLYLSSTVGEFNLSGLANYGLLRGKNVLNNDKLYLRAAIDRDVYADEDTALNIGLGVNYTSFSKNEAFYTFGHGGYYSPQSSLSFSLPIELSGRADQLSYQVRASVSYARSKEDAAAFYPTNAALQAQAAAGPFFPSGNTGAIYTGGSGGGFGYGLRAATEYRVTPNIALGGRFSMDRSAYYAPNSLLMYMRYMFKPETGPVKLKPDSITPYSQY